MSVVRICVRSYRCVCVTSHALHEDRHACVIVDTEGRSFGVFTHSLVHIISSYSAQELHSLTYRGLIMKVHEVTLFIRF